MDFFHKKEAMLYILADRITHVHMRLKVLRCSLCMASLAGYELFQ